jgi:hypothetical protein
MARIGEEEEAIVGGIANCNKTSGQVIAAHFSKLNASQ